VTRASSWLTAVRLKRLCVVAQSVPSSQLGSAVEDVVDLVWDTVGGDRGEVYRLIDILRQCGLAEETCGLLRRTRAGDRTARALRTSDPKPLGRELIRAGLMHDQARYLIESGQMHENGDLECELRVARSGAAQLLGLLDWWEVQAHPSVVVPKKLLDELNTVWALLPPPSSETPTWARRRQAIGDRAEMYTVQNEKLRAADPSSIAWVARDSSSLGWDVEDRGASPLRRIEVKGSQDAEPAFFLSDNEWRKAGEHPDSYEVQFWGCINLSLPAAEEFEHLRAQGYPVIVQGIIAAITAGVWAAVPTNWRISKVSSS
jgi:hypothetical protein